MVPSTNSVRSDDMSSSPSLLLNNSTYYYNKQLLRTGAFADCTVVTSKGGRSWPAHRNILSPRCDFFKCCLDGRFTEGQTRVIAMDDDDPIAVEGMLYYLYTLDYPVELYERLLGVEAGSGSDSGIEEDESTTTGRDARLDWGFDLLMYSIADKYGLAELRQLAGETLLGKAESAGKEQRLGESMDGFVALIETFYAREGISDKARGLRTQVISSTSEAITHHVRDQRISTLMSDLPEFAIELVEALGKKRDERRLVQREQDKRHEAARLRINHIPMNDESDFED